MAPTRIEVSVEDLKDGSMKEVNFPNADSKDKILLAKVGGQVYATGNKCTHYGAPLVKGVLTASGRVVCPWHGACFDVKCGDIEDAPGLSSLQSFKVETDGSKVYVIPPTDLTKISAFRPPPSVASSASSNVPGVIIVGGGSGGAHAVEGLRESGYTGPIKVISSEAYLPIDRTKLSKGLMTDPAKVALRNNDFYTDLGVDFKLHSDVTKIDFEQDRVQLSSGESYAYEHLIVATGSNANRIPVDGSTLSNIFVMRTIEDAKLIDAALGSDETVKKNVVVIGSSFIGMEVALACAGRASVTIVGMEDAPFQAILGSEIGNGIRKFHESKGTKFYLPAALSHFTASKSTPTDVGAVLLKDGTEIPADFVVLGVGVKPATALFKESGLALEKDGSVLVDGNLRVTGVAKGNVFAIGDIAKFPDAVTGELTRVEHWNVAANHGRSVAKTISGKPDRYNKIAVFWSAQGQGLRYAGTGRAKEWTDVILQGDANALKFIAYYTNPIAAQCSELFALGKMLTATEIKAGKSPLDIPLA